MKDTKSLLICCCCIDNRIPSAAMDTALSFAAMGMSPAVLLEIDSQHESEHASGKPQETIKEQAKQLAEFGIDNLFVYCSSETSDLGAVARNHLKEIDEINNSDLIQLQESADAILSF